jgi:predicted RNA binding protein YcfA (HicA-like mRNA interferase family)
MSKLPVLRAKQIVRVLERAGFLIHHSTGSHAQLKHPQRPGLLVTVPYHTRDVPRRILHSILRQAQLSPEEFLELL